METISQLIHAVTGKERLQDCSEDDLRQMVRLYPFFGPAHLLLAKKDKEEHPEQATAVSAKASLFVPNSLWFDRLMNETVTTIDQVIHDTILETPATEEDVIEQPPVAEEMASPVEPTTTVLEEPVTEEEVIEQPHGQLQQEEITETEKEEDEPVMFADTLVTEEGSEDDYGSETDETEDHIATINEPELRPIPSLKIEPLDPGKMELSFEPYHTVDYFASQGIRFKDEERPKDRLSQQLKSFTEWLKTLKKVPATEIPAGGTTVQEEKKVEQMAQTSISDPEVVTEAMAEVWEKQGNTIKALELYKKLSLLDPAKSAYFAAKIEHLKQL